MKALAIILAALAVLSGTHVIVRLAGCPVAVPGLVLALAAELAACAVFGVLIARTPRFRSHPCIRSLT